MIVIRHRFTNVVICEFDVETIKEAVQLAIESKINLSYSDLSYSDLSGSNLHGSNLRGSNLSYSDLSGSDLSGSDLRDCDLSYSYLNGSNLSGSNLSYSNLDGEILKKTPLIISGLVYHCLISDNYLRLGCKRFTHQEWADFNDVQIRVMDFGALEFWKQWKESLLALCAAHKGESK